jgi:ABC-2 type transport system permease protein
MTALIRAEFLGLRTLRSGYMVPISLVALAALIAGLSLPDAGKRGLRTPAQLREPVVAGAGLLTAVALSIFVALLVAGQYRHRTITQRLLASPRRQRTLGAALLTYGVLSLVVAAVALSVSVAVGQAVISGKHLSLGLSTGVVAGALLSVVLFTALGVSVGVITRNQPAAVVVLVGTFVAEKILDTFIGHAGAFLPFGLLDPLLGLSGATISRGAAALTLLGIATGVGLFATVLLIRRDVT